MVNRIAEETELPKTKKGLREMAEIVGLSSMYIYNKLGPQIKGRKDDATCRLRDEHLDVLLKYFKCKTLQEFINTVDNPIPPQLLHLVGHYYSYVRRNINAETLWRSPVEIWQEKGRLIMTLKGKTLQYAGEIRLRKGTLFVPLDSTSNKAFFHVYKIGEAVRPKILQGVFTGVSDTLEPIGGRAVLARMPDGVYPKQNMELKIKELKKSADIVERRLAEYFHSFENNNLSINPSYNFDERDLGKCR